MKKSQKGAVAILITTLVLSVLLSLSLVFSEIVIKNLKLSFDFKDSIRAFYAADAVIEKCLYDARQGEGSCTSVGGTVFENFSNGASSQATRTAISVIEAVGSFGSANRKIRIDWTTQ